ncbi:pentapeptide repeat-containing protein [Sulfurimonas hydrogeniphila]|uniref:pentapeptide repeat-containing protein n=1 Tax=Sulfurimonas hydrogeniphila TaxID=2509341 RepID=UPI00125F9B5A|nr:pentapeptide repeat-containing protein [Sulfurimonas hydrogeniphila]
MKDKRYTCSVCDNLFEEQYFDKEQNKCILHCEKTDKNDWYSINASNEKEWTSKIKTFWSYIQLELNNIYEYSFYDVNGDSDYTYTKVIFPKFETEYEYDFYNEDDMGTNFFSFKVFEHPNEQPMPEVNQIFNKLNITFENCIFLDVANFGKYDRTHPISFEQCQFKKTVLLSKTQKSEVSFYECDFSNQDLCFSESNFENMFIMKDCQNINLLDISYATFNSFANFMNSTFNKTNFTATEFFDTVVFINVTFQDHVSFNYTTFAKLVLFRDSKFKKTLDLRDSIFRDEATFLGVEVNPANRETARQIKSSFEQQKNLIESNKYYALELREKRKELSFFKNPFEWIIFKIHWVSSNHSQSYISGLVWILVIGILGIKDNAYDSIVSLMDGDKKLDSIAMSLHSLLKFSSENISMYHLVLKAILAYLIYQFIVSVRQNTKRK